MKPPIWWLRLAVALCAAGVALLIVFFLLVWPPGALLVLALALLAAGLIVDVPKSKNRQPRP